MIITLDIDDLKHIIQAKKYENFKGFRVKVLEISLREIATFSDIEVSYDLKRGLSNILLKHKSIYEVIEHGEPALYDNILINRLLYIVQQDKRQIK